ncbi:NFACT RNA binding domain-containing protein [Campylobacter ureolyticus]|uniref:NFACT RNA binding domain-containing protein n=1 Tax=Campylobacter ureolyticus TaxID=827 RepID=A0A9Q4KKS7_9BACT|nr:NFACT RNA binding domain-containing protein [Campylobacter ureolyticus]MCZ6159290.1 NFACT RNA binding domain-containing protein [Campylobacter ureolyticus]MCZ6162693.1 NFACT RNA binding domain-containing protein [Campylobacter ureolyticus]MCZ6164814.1 NFACT RNA binding domain-containing protein [Campylobacter ureolyticus]MCZ6166612.1 NFACT RNA binding domain-containing protein [Campylobacter ureolyticus]
MKYKTLMQIADFLKKFEKINSIKRVGDRVVLIEFDKQNTIFFDMDKQNSAIYKNDDYKHLKSYKAPFDVVLSKRFNASNLINLEVLENNRILFIKARKSGSYKEIVSNLYFEFTGRFTNIIITDENDNILEALSHYENTNRSIKPGKTLKHLSQITIKEKPSQIIVNFDEFLKSEFEKINSKKLFDIKNSKITILDKKIDSLAKNLTELESQENLLEKSIILNKKGEILTANLHLLNDFQKEFVLKDFNGNDVFFKCEKSPKLEAKNLFDESKKLRQKASGVKFEKANLNEKIEFFTALKSLVKNASNLDEIEILLPKKHSKNKKSHLKKGNENIENFYINEFKISVGKNEKGNISLLKNSKKDDFWFHLKDIPSAHVIVKTNKQNLSDEIIKMAAKICVNFSVKNSGNFEVDYTKRANVKVVDGAFVNYINYKTITILKT